MMLLSLEQVDPVCVPRSVLQKQDSIPPAYRSCSPQEAIRWRHKEGSMQRLESKTVCVLHEAEGRSDITLIACMRTIGDGTCMIQSRAQTGWEIKTPYTT